MHAITTLKNVTISSLLYQIKRIIDPMRYQLLLYYISLILYIINDHRTLIHTLMINLLKIIQPISYLSVRVTALGILPVFDIIS